MKNNRRLYPRRPWQGKVVFENEYGEGLMYLRARDLSLGGLFLEEGPPMRLGSQLLLSFVLPGKKRPIRITGQVMRFIEAGEKGTGIRFVDLPPKTFHHLAEFLQK